MTARAKLDAALLQAHGVDDKSAMVRIYTDAANLAQSESDDQAMCFYLTHAYVFALEIGAPEADVLHARLKAEWREE